MSVFCSKKYGLILLLSLSAATVLGSADILTQLSEDNILGEDPIQFDEEPLDQYPIVPIHYGGYFQTGHFSPLDPSPLRHSINRLLDESGVVLSEGPEIGWGETFSSYRIEKNFREVSDGNKYSRFFFAPTTDIDPSDLFNLISHGNFPLETAVASFTRTVKEDNLNAVGYFPLALGRKFCRIKDRRHWVLLVLDSTSKSARIYNPQSVNLGYDMSGINEALKSSPTDNEEYQYILPKDGIINQGHQGLVNFTDCGWFLLTNLSFILEGTRLETLDQTKVYERLFDIAGK